MKIPYALGCPSCTYMIEVSEEDPDCTLSDLVEHILVKHAGYDQRRAMAMLAGARELTETQAARR